MYGRQGQSNYSSNSNNSYSNSNNSYSNSYNNNYNRNEEKLGSYRLEYKYDEPPGYLTSIITNWKGNPPLSITTREETLHLTVTELRVQDYYLIRNKKLRSNHEDRLRDAIRKDAFNDDIRSNCYNLMPYSRDNPMSADVIKSICATSQNNSYGSNNNNNNNSSGSMYSSRNNIFGSSNSYGSNNNNNSSYGSNNNNSSYGNNSNNNSSYGSNNNSYNYSSSNNNSSNIFNRNNSSSNSYGNNSNNNNSNIFSSNNNSSSNIFNRNSTSGNNSYSNNSYSYGNNSYGNNSYNNNSNNSYNNNNNNSSNNIFNRGNNSSGSNIFNNNNNNNNSNNIFNNGNNNNNSGSNIFNNNNNSNNNGRNNIFNNGNNNGGNNIFNNGNNNGNNIFSNNGNRNIFSNGNNNTNGNIFSNNGMYNQNPIDFDPRIFPQIHHYMKNMNELLKHIWDKDEDKSTNNNSINSNSLFPTYDSSYIDVYENQLRTKKKRQEDNMDIVILVPQTSKPEHQDQGNYSIKQTRSISNSQIRQDSNRSGINKSQFLGNNKSQVLSSTFRTKSVIKEERIEEISEDEDCECTVKLSIQWLDSKFFKGHKLPSEINATVEIAGFKPESRGWKQQLLFQLKNPLIRSDATLEISSSEVMRKGQRVHVQVTGVLNQRILNNKADVCEYQRFENGLLIGLTLSNSHGKVSWKEPVKVQHLDFGHFAINDNEIEADPESPLNCQCEVEFYKVPAEILRLLEVSKEDAKKKMSKAVDEQGEGKFRLLSLEKTKWVMEVLEFP